MPCPYGVVSVALRRRGRTTSWARDVPPEPTGGGEGGIPADGPEAQDRPQAGCRQGEVSFEPGRAGGPLRRGGLLRRRCAAHGGDDADAGERLPVPGRDRRRQGREPGAVQRRVQHVTGGVAGEHPAGAVGAVGGGRRPTSSTSASGSPNDGPGRPQYGWSANDARRPDRATSSRHCAAARHAEIRACSSAMPSRTPPGAQPRGCRPPGSRRRPGRPATRSPPAPVRRTGRR